ncbi:DUF2793 domain-containing protein [Phyllobacterium sp. YR531]|uniref:DUF2793 domain-containing protein n=1 Tax=Phyllobacterium sp. YR531 TaxID=1144343 RepID=UPI00026F906D|nr:DUF2793 domain-containing protein [Phyllobacterium sp. YR531]EJM98454.1 Protein of unknown function (DUF2793) [Phyllobacterium sp. YR531]
MEQTSNLKLPYIAPSQAQKHVTHNEAIRALDALVQLSVVSRNLSVPPVATPEGARYIIGVQATGLWANRDNQIAAWQDAAWAFFTALEGWNVWVEEEKNFFVFHQKKWTRMEVSTNPVSLLGVAATADDTNRLSIKSPASLFDHSGSGHQLKINKADDNQAASLLFQSNYQGRAEMGTMWGRDFRIKASADGTQWFDVMVADGATGLARFPSGVAHAATGKKQSGFIFLPASAVVATIFQPPSAPATPTVVSVSGNLLNLGVNMAAAIFATSMRGAAMVRIWNTTRSPAQSAWVKWDTTTDQLQVSNPDHIKSWLKGDAIQIIDPAKKNIAVDISPLMQKAFGAVFLQDGVLLNAGPASDMTIFCNELSPISASNLVYLKGDEKRSLMVMGVYG